MVGQKIEDAIEELLTGDSKKNAMDFVAYMSANDMQLEWYEGIWFCNSSVVLINGAAQCPGPWTIFHSGYGHEYPPDEIPAGKDDDKIGLSDLTVDEHLKEVAWAHVKSCFNFTSNEKECGCGRQPGRHTTVFGKEFDNVCTATLAFCNPDAETLVYIKKLVELMKLGRLKTM